MQPKFPRYALGQIEVLQNKLNMTPKYEHKIRINTGKTVLNQTQTFISSPISSNKSKLSQRRVSTPMSISEIDTFEKNQLRNMSPFEKRSIYSLN